MSRWHLNKLVKHDAARCTKCLQPFNENDVIATSTSKRYCYECAIQINLVTGKIKNDLHIDKLVLDVLSHIDSIAKKLRVDVEICKLAVLLVNTAIENTNYVSKNEIGLACAAIFLAHEINKQSISEEIFPVSIKTLQKNTNLLKKSLTTTDICTLSQKIHGLVR